MKQSLLSRLISGALHILALGVIAGFLWPIASWYLSAKPLWGVDFYYTMSMVQLLKDNLTLPMTQWFHAWFSGWPWVSGYPVLHYYFILPFTYVFDLMTSVEVWMVATIGIYLWGLYAVFYFLSKSRIISVLLSIAAIYSVGLYGSLMWGGSLPSHATQLFFPWVVYFLLRYLAEKNRRFLAVGILLSGMAIVGHPQMVISYIFPSVGILALFFPSKISIIKKIKLLLVFYVTAVIIGLPILHSSSGEALKSLIYTDSHEVASSTVKVPTEETGEIAAFHMRQPLRMIEDTNPAVFYLLGFGAIVYLIALVIARKKAMLLYVLPFVVLALFYVFYTYLFAFGISIYHGGWYRLFWACAFWIGMLVAALWGSATGFFTEKSKKMVDIPRLIVGGVTLVALAIGSWSLATSIPGVKDKIVLRSNPSSAFPDVLNLRTDTKGFVALKSELVPAWLNADDTNYRLYGSDQTVNIWWNSFYDMPIARGYLDQPIPSIHKGYSFWLDAALSQTNETQEDQLVGSFDYPQEQAFNNTMFLLNWHGIKYFEAGHAGPTVFAPLPKSLTTEEFIEKSEELDFNKEKYNKGNQTLHYWQLKDAYISPILMSTNAPTLGVIASDTTYETVVRMLADGNMGIEKVIPLKLGKQIEKINKRDLDSVDALFIYEYEYDNRNKVFSMLEEYLKSGKNVFFETGLEVREATNDNLPELFPFTATERKQLGSEWKWEIPETTDALVKDIDFEAFAPPLFDDQQWSFSYPVSDSDIKEDTKVVVTNHGKPIVATRQIGDGQIIWSGMNLPYHVTRNHVGEEVKFMSAIITKLVGETTNKTTEFKTTFVNAQKRQLWGKNARGVIFKEQAYPGWHAQAIVDKRKSNLTIYKTGPTYPGYMYVRLPKAAFEKEFDVHFSYRGSMLNWVLISISLLISLFVIDFAAFGGWLVGNKVVKFIKKMTQHTSHWWSKDDDKE